jgi:lipid-A-disaccharide synthase
MGERDIFWIAGENSGDLHASMVLKELNRRGLKMNHFGIGGQRMEREGFTALFPFKRFNVMGFWEVLQHLKFFFHVEKQIRQRFLAFKPDLAILVDYPGFNLRIAQMAYDMDIPVLYFICPQFWAWKRGRVNKLRENTNMVATILPFESELLDIHRVNSHYVGHPIAEEIINLVDKETFAKTFGLDQNKRWLGFMPGSRENEVKKMLPPMIKAIEKFNESEFEFLVSKAHTISHDRFNSLIPKKLKHRIHIVDGYVYEMMKYTNFMVVTSGTATLETAFIGTPHIIVYKTSQISYLIAKKLVKIGRIGLPNIMLEQNLLPELIQKEVNGENIYKKVSYYLEHKDEFNRLANELEKVKYLLSEKTTSVEMSNLIIKMLNEK